MKYLISLFLILSIHSHALAQLNDVNQISIVHLGIADKPVRSLIISINPIADSIIKKDRDIKWYFHVDSATFVKLSDFIIKNNTHCQQKHIPYPYGTFLIGSSTPNRQINYVLEKSDTSHLYVEGLINIVQVSSGNAALIEQLKLIAIRVKM